MKITLVTVGRFKSPELDKIVAHYLKLASKFVQIDLEPLSLAKNVPEQQAGDFALAKYLEKKGSRVFLTLLDERGKQFTSREFASRVEKIKDASHSDWVIAVGGAHGYGEELKKRAGFLWSLSSLTFAHELATAVAAEQIFRAFSILNNHPYHND